MIRLLLMTLILLLLNGCATGYPSWKYRCYETQVKPGVDVPAMPDCRANNKTLGGIDIDNDGVRDDIQRYIAGLDFDHEFFKRGLTQYAQALRTTLLEYDRKEQAQLNSARINLAIDCALSADIYLISLFNIRDEVKDLHLNTFKRRFAHSHWRSYLETQLVPSVVPEDACDFDIMSTKGERWR